MAATESAYPRDDLGRVLLRLCSGFAIAGGFVLAAMIVLVVVSVMGRALFALPVPGDFEIVGFGTGVAVFLFLPHCYIQRGNVAVDIFVRNLSPGAQRAMDLVSALVFALVGALFTWRMLFGLADTFRYGDISMIVGLSLWWAYPIAVASFALLTVCAFYTAVRGWESVADE
jgi:TRAP-type C4-dicarboxylate transport system permease small subunit